MQYMYIYLYNILGFVRPAVVVVVVVVLLSIHPPRHPSCSSKFLIPEEKDDGTGGR